MDKSILEHIKLLTGLDTKTVGQRVIKLFEEGGELARVVAPYENVSSTRHRIVERTKILEEAVDASLVSLSIAYHMGFTDEEVEEMFRQKLLKWDSILSKEKKTNGKPIPYEIHVTVKASDIDDFRLACDHIGVKPIVLSLQNNLTENIMQDVMTSSTHLGDNTSALMEAGRIKNFLSANLFEVVRVKIETVPWHPAAPTNPGDEMPKDCYFESHVAVRTTADDKEALADLAEIHGAHMSKNVFKVIDESNYVQMLTLRSYDGIFSEFDRSVDQFIERLENEGFNLDKKIIEFSVYDTRVSHDAAWISKPN